MTKLADITPLTHLEYLKIAQHSSLIVPTLMPDELLLGYLGRLGFVNDYPDYLTAKKILKNIFVNHYHKEYQYPLALQLANILNVDPEMIVKNHTLVPIMRSIDTQNIPSHDVSVLKAMGYSLAKPNVCFCENCISEDLNYIGHSYWRRSHQIHGIDFCYKHDTPLMMATIENAHYQFPQKIFKSGKFLQQKIISSEYKHPVIQKYIQLIDDYIEIQSTIKYRYILKMLKHKALMKNTTKSQGAQHYISDFIIENTPINWLVKHFPIFKKKSLNVPICCIDAPHKAPNLFNLLLMISNMMPEANSQILQSRRSSFSPTLPHLNNHLTKFKANILYKKHNEIYTQISEELARFELKTTHHLQQFRLPVQDDLNDATSEAVLDFFRGTSLKNIMQRKSVNFTAFEMLIRKGSQLKMLGEQAGNSY